MNFPAILVEDLGVKMGIAVQVWDSTHMEAVGRKSSSINIVSRLVEEW